MKKRKMRMLTCGGAALLLVALTTGLAGMGHLQPPWPERAVVINEVAWAGTAASTTDEWIELYNTTDGEIDLSGWRLVSDDGSPDIVLSGVIPARGFFLLERGDDETISDIPADQLYQGALSNSGETLRLFDPEGRLIDTANGDGGPWPAGTAAYDTPPYASMERITPSAQDTDANWATNEPEWARNGLDADGNPLCGTPKAANSVFNLPPVADFSYWPLRPTTQDTIYFTDQSSDPDGRVIRWEWDFGDGTGSELQTPSHRYADDGRYVVRLTVTDDRGATDEVSQTIEVANVAPTAAFSVSPEEAPTGELITFDASASTDPDGKITRYEWDFDGDGVFDASVVLPKLAHSFADDGTYTVRLRVTDDDGATDMASRTVRILNRPPQVRFRWEPERPTDMDTIKFIDQSTDPDGRVVSWRWDFGDGTGSELQTPSHRYADDGSYIVQLTVTDDDGAEASTSRVITIANVAPMAVFSFTPEEPTVEDVIQFIDQSSDPDGQIVFWGWDFGDGTQLIGQQNPVHRYARPGTYTVILTVIDDDGAIDKASREITVAP